MIKEGNQMKELETRESVSVVGGDGIVYVEHNDGYHPDKCRYDCSMMTRNDPDEYMPCVTNCLEKKKRWWRNHVWYPLAGIVFVVAIFGVIGCLDNRQNHGQ